MEAVRNVYLLVLSAWMVCAGLAQPYGPAINDSTDNSQGGTLVIPFRASIAVTIVVLAALITLTFLLLVYIRQRRGGQNRVQRRGLMVHRNPGRARLVSSGGILPLRDMGVERSVIDALPVFKFAALQGLKEGLECAVCLSRFEGPDVLRLMPKCRHAFHVVCVDTWLESNCTCPLCRQRVEAEDVCMVYRNEDVEEAKGLEDRGPQLLQAFVQRENVEERESESPRFTREGSSRQPVLPASVGSAIRCFSSGRKKGLLISKAEEEAKELEFSRRFAHRIVVADAMSQHRWSDIEHSELLFLSSEMITTDSSRMDFAEVKQTAEIETNRGATQTKTMGGSSAHIALKRSISETIGFNRFQSRGRNNKTLLPLTKGKWFSLPKNTEESLACSDGNANDKRDGIHN